MENFTDNFLPNLLTEGLILRRDPQFGVFTNVLHLVTHHSPNGFEFGYGGSGPADLALNVCEMLLHGLKYNGPRMDCYRGDCFVLAWILHEEFKRRFITPAPLEGKTIPYAELRAWIEPYTKDRV